MTDESARPCVSILEAGDSVEVQGQGHELQSVDRQKLDCRIPFNIEVLPKEKRIGAIPLHRTTRVF